MTLTEPWEALLLPLGQYLTSSARDSSLGTGTGNTWA